MAVPRPIIVTVEGSFEIAVPKESFEACWNGEKHHVFFFAVTEATMWVKKGSRVTIVEEDSLSNRLMHVMITCVEDVEVKVGSNKYVGHYVLSFHHIHRSGQSCCQLHVERMTEATRG